jgi:glycerate kinase
LDETGKNISFGAVGLEKLTSICVETAITELRECTFRVACDVNNPLCGEYGCSAVYGPQKGADEAMIRKMDLWLENYADLALLVSEKADKNYPGAGAAGGLGFAFLSFLNAKLESGIQIILEEMGFEQKIQKADIVVTGEGRLDSQSVMGKVPVGVAKLAKKYGKRVIAFAGCITEDARICNDHGIDAFFPILRGVSTLEEALETDNARENLIATAYQVFRLIE